MLTRGLWEWGRDGADAAFSTAHVQETRDMEVKARARYESLKATDNLQAIYFDEAGGNHDFPTKVRESAYQFMDRHLRHG
jgi:hypothetical protein